RRNRHLRRHLGLVHAHHVALGKGPGQARPARGVDHARRRRHARDLRRLPRREGERHGLRARPSLACVMAGKVEKLLAKGKTLEGKGRRDKALEVYRAACRSAPYDPDLWTARAKAAEALGLRAEAAEALFHVSELYARSGAAAVALPVVKQVLGLDG